MILCNLSISLSRSVPDEILKIFLKNFYYEVFCIKTETVSSKLFPLDLKYRFIPFGLMKYKSFSGNFSSKLPSVLIIFYC